MGGVAPTITGGEVVDEVDGSRMEHWSTQFEISSDIFCGMKWRNLAVRSDQDDRLERSTISFGSYLTRVYASTYVSLVRMLREMLVRFMLHG